jgi:hypothetical protein
MSSLNGEIAIDPSLATFAEEIAVTLLVVRIGFLIAGLYDFIIGLAFLFAGAWIFDNAGVPPPNHWAYIEFASLLLIVFGTMFFAIAADPISHRNLMPFGMLLKVCYTGLVAYYWATAECPMLFKPFAIIDGMMFVLFWLAYTQRLGPRNVHMADA